jgi:hypothetical protein
MYNLSLDPATYETIRALAAKDRRSVRGQLLWIVDEYYAKSDLKKEMDLWDLDTVRKSVLTGAEK